MNLPARHAQLPVPRGRRLSGHPDAVRARVAELSREVASRGLVVEQTPRGWNDDGTVTVDVRFRPAPRRRRRGARFWGIVAAVITLGLAGCAWGVVLLVQSLVDAAGRAAGAILPALLGLIVVFGAIVVAAGVKGGGGTFSGTFKGHMD